MIKSAVGNFNAWKKLAAHKRTGGTAFVGQKKPRYGSPAPNSTVSQPSPVNKKKGVAVQSQGGKPNAFVSPGFAPGVSLAPGWSIEYGPDGKPQRFAPPGSPSGSGGAGAPGGTNDPIKIPSGPPTDSIYTQTVGLNDRDYNSTVAGAIGKQNELGLNSGINFTRKDDGTLGSYGIADNVDVTNPFSTAALLKRAYQQRTTGNTNSYAAQGQLYAGSLQNAQNESGFQNQSNINQLLKQFASQFGGTVADISNAGTTRDRANIGAMGDLIGRQPPPAPGDVTALAPGGVAYDTKNAPYAAPGGKDGQGNVVKLANGWGVLYGADGKPVRFLSPAELKSLGGK